MLVVLKESVASNGTNQTVAINISSHDYIEIIKVEAGFQLVFRKIFDAHFSNRSSMFSIIANFDTHQKCVDLFNQIIDALQCGNTVLDLRDTPKSELKTAEITPM